MLCFLVPGQWSLQKLHAQSCKDPADVPDLEKDAALAADFSPELCQTQPFPMFAMAGPKKREWSTSWAAQLSCQGMFDASGVSNRSLC